MRKMRIPIFTGLLGVLLVLPGSAADRYLVRMDPSVAQAVARQHGARLEASLHGSAEGLHVISVPSGPFGNILVTALKANPLVQSVEPDGTAWLSEASSKYDGSGHTVPGLNKYTGPNSIPGTAWSPYVNQPANHILRISDAQRKFGYGAGSVVAIIDTGVDCNHPALASSISCSESIDYTGEGVIVQQETTPMVDQETTPMVDSIGTIILNQETTPMVDQETTPMVDNSIPAFAGHGTMTAGIVHLVAPLANLISIKVFSTYSGTGNISDVVAGINYAVAHGATVINMSFGTSQKSQALADAIKYAAQHNVICVASTGNDASPVIDAPSNDGPTIAVTATDNQGYLASYANYGAGVTLGATGNGILSPFPGNHYALGWGTSFAAPFVSGAAALLGTIDHSLTPKTLADDLSKAANKAKSNGVGAGVLDVFGSANFASH